MLIEKIGGILRRKDSNKDTREQKSAESGENIHDKVVTLKIYRANRNDRNYKAHYDYFEIPTKRWTTVLDALIYAKEHLDASICIRYSCRMASCGSCGMMINGIPRLACYTKVWDLASGDMITCEPLVNFPFIRDLVTDFSQFFAHHKNVKPYTIGDKEDTKDAKEQHLSEFKQSPEDVDRYLQFSYCIKCGLCCSACPVVATDVNFPGPQALAQAYRYFIDTRDNASKERMDTVDNKHGIWRCHFAGSCSAVCPKGVDPALGIQLFRGYLMGFQEK
jgi:succinate dehydrogenase / fumarate reductase iron-sulfur subunit